MIKNNGSANALISIGKGGRGRKGSKYNHQDQILSGFYRNPGFTAKEIAADVYDWKYERYADASKRAHDLFKLGYLSHGDNRECRRSGKDAHTFHITQAGIDKLIDIGLLGARIERKTKSIESPSDPLSVDRKKALAGFKEQLGH